MTVRLIDADALLEYARRECCFPGAVMFHQVVNAPTVDAAPVVHGRWVDNVDENGFLRNAWRTCSSCGGLNWSKKPNYCPHCGAKMDLEEM